MERLYDAEPTQVPDLAQPPHQPRSGVTHNLIVGIAIGLLALGSTQTPERMYGLSWAFCTVGIWMIIAPWVWR
jgi:hypothetical protein